MAKEKHICSGKNKRKGYVGLFIDYTHGSDRRKCKSTASVFENDEWYCKRHAPSEIEKREAKSWQNYIKKNIQ